MDAICLTIAHAFLVLVCCFYFGIWRLYNFCVFLCFFFRDELTLSFEESVYGCQRKVNVTYFETCDKCNGTGAKSSSCIKSCKECGGRGRVMNSQKMPFGIVSQVKWNWTKASFHVTFLVMFVTNCEHV